MMRRRRIPTVTEIPKSVIDGLRISASSDERQRASSVLWSMMYPRTALERFLPQVVVPVVFDDTASTIDSDVQCSASFQKHFTLPALEYTFEQTFVHTAASVVDPGFRLAVAGSLPMCVLYGIPQTSSVTMSVCVGPVVTDSAGQNSSTSSPSCAGLNFLSDCSGRCAPNALYNRATNSISLDRVVQVFQYAPTILSKSLVEMSVNVLEDVRRVFSRNGRQSRYWSMIFLRALSVYPDASWYREASHYYMQNIQDAIADDFFVDNDILDMMYEFESKTFANVVTIAQGVARLYDVTETLSFSPLDADDSPQLTVPRQNKYFSEGTDNADLPEEDILSQLDTYLMSILALSEDSARGSLEEYRKPHVHLYAFTVSQTLYVVFVRYESIRIFVAPKPYQKTPYCSLFIIPEHGYELWFAGGARGDELPSIAAPTDDGDTM